MFASFWHLSSRALSRNGCSGVELGKESGVCERTQVDVRIRKVQAGMLGPLLRQRGRLSALCEEAFFFFLLSRYFARETTMSAPGHTPITRG